MSQRRFDVVESEPVQNQSTQVFRNADYQNRQMYGAGSITYALPGQSRGPTEKGCAMFFWSPS